MTAQASTLDNDFERQFFSYVVDAAVAGNASATAQFSILSDADFEAWWIKASRTSNLLKVLMEESATSRQFIGQSATATGAFNGINIDLWAGTAQNGAAWPLAVPYIMPATRNYKLTFTDSSGSTNNVEVVFDGFKLWPTPQGAASAATPTQ